MISLKRNTTEYGASVGMIGSLARGDVAVHWLICLCLWSRDEQTGSLGPSTVCTIPISHFLLPLAPTQRTSPDVACSKVS